MNEVKEYCSQVSSTPMGNLCRVTKQECFTPFSRECDEPEWGYYMEMAEDFVGEEVENL